MTAPLQFPYRRGSGAFEVSLPCANCGDEVAMSWPPTAANPTPARLVARCRTCQEVAYVVARGDDGRCRVHPCGPGPYASWPDKAWRAPPKAGSNAIYGPEASPAKYGFAPAGDMGPVGATPARRYARAASAPRQRSNAAAANVAGGARRRGVSAERRGVSAERQRWERPGADRDYVVEDDWVQESYGPPGGYRDEMQDDMYEVDQPVGHWHGAYDRAPLANHRQAEPLLRTFAAAVFARYPDEASAFRAFDLNGNGMVGISEFQACADAMYYQGDAASVFWELDADRRGFLGRREFAMLRRWAPQAAPPSRAKVPAPQARPMRSASAPRARAAPSEAYDRRMPPAGRNIETVGRELGQRTPMADPHRQANVRHRNAQQGSGVASALDSWGEWRNWQNDSAFGSVVDDPASQPPYRQNYRQYAWDD